MELTNARILLTGATGGLGQALAGSLAEQGADLLLVGRDEARLENGVSSIGGIGGTGRIALSLRTDLNLAEDIAKTAKAARAFGVNVLNNNVGIIAFGLYEKQDWRTVEQVMATNLLAPMQLTSALLPWLKGRERATRDCHRLEVGCRQRAESRSGQPFGLPRSCRASGCRRPARWPR